MRFTKALALSIAISSPAPGHHSEAGLDMVSVVTFEGTVTVFAWRNPHVYTTVETTNERGESVECALQMGSALVMGRRGWSRDALAVGDRVTVHAHPSVDGRPHPPMEERFDSGYSIGSWEGDTLVVDVRNFSDHRSPYQIGVPSGGQKRVVERYRLLEDGLLVDPAMAGRLRRKPVGISSSSYLPLDDRFAIEEEFGVLVEKAAAITDPFEQSFFLLVHIPYLQAFEDINKRTSRIASNIPLLKADLAPMSFLTMDDGAYIDGLIGICELNNVSLLREVYVDAYLASAENYRVLRAELESPEKAALAYRDFVRDAVRRSVLEWKGFRPDDTSTMAADAGIPETDREQVVNYVGNELRGLHEGNAIRYRLRPEHLCFILDQHETKG